jgi:Xaa-Pro aminopeptidase
MAPDEISSFTEKSLAYNIEGNMINMGAEGRSFDLVVAGNSSASLPHYAPSSKRIKEGLLLLDIGCRINNYCSDLTRTFFIDLGKGSFKNNRAIGKLMQIYDIVLQAQDNALKACKAGLTCSELDLISRQHIEDAGYGKQYMHGLGHGLGLEIHERPTVSFADNTILEEGMVITIEPAIYIEGLGGVRIEDVVVVRKDNCENLYGDTKSIKIIV